MPACPSHVMKAFPLPQSAWTTSAREKGVSLGGRPCAIVPMQAVLASNLELFRAQEKKNKECQQLQEDVELKNAQISSLEEARKKDEGDKAFFAFFSSDFFSFSDKYFSRLSFYL